MILILLFLSNFLAHLSKFKNVKPIMWHPKRWWEFCMPEDEKKE